MTDEKLLNKLCKEVEKYFQLGGLSSGLYADYAKEVAKRYLKYCKKKEKKV